MSETWVAVCQDDDLIAGTGVCALVGEEQVAVFKLRATGELFAIGNYDPIGQANVLSRGITGSLGDALVVASPLYKHHFNLQTGQCLEDSSIEVSTYPVRLHEGQIEVALG
ncbi:nitrite reductase small subunit NirD [Halioxenophilus sp. WMMB6]|uniref:nitrite reductase small subunit NirD n=1 Tax=Halioxenophilus sp. WMMB6 TaxID=3073815 RepID=UPI00295ED108|nr:nitrite reductase small subunit NirD [Halioxenophilus sp. WMMB6]